MAITTTVLLELDPLDALEALLIDQQATGDAEGAAKTRAMIARIKERRRLRKQAIKSGRWPFVVSDPPEGPSNDERFRDREDL